MKYLTKHKEMSLLFIIMVILAIAAFNLMSGQPKTSKFIKAGASELSPLVPNGAPACEIRTPDLYEQVKLVP